MRLAKTYTTCAALVLLTSMAALAGDWPQFRGPRRDGHADAGETGLLKSWPEGGPKMLWNAAGIGKGYSQPVVAGGLVYTTGLVDGKGVLQALDLNGKIKWSQPYGPEWDGRFPGARCIPTVCDGRVYVLSSKGTMACFDAAAGTPIWSDDMFKRYGARDVMWGYAEGLLIDGENVIFFPCGKGGTAAAVDRKTGKAVWASKDLGHKSGYCSPLLVEHGGTRMVVSITKGGVVAVSPADGTILWQNDYANRNGNHPDTPIYHDGMLYITSGYGKGAVGLKLAPDGRSVTQLWAERKQDTIHGNVVLVDGAVYGSAHQNAGGQWVCLDFATGKILWVAPCVGPGGSVSAADGMLYCYGEKGTFGLVKPSREKCELVSTFKVPFGRDEHWAHPAISGGRLYIRHGDVLMCYDVKAP